LSRLMPLFAIAGRNSRQPPGTPRVLEMRSAWRAAGLMRQISWPMPPVSGAVSQWPSVPMVELPHVSQKHAFIARGGRGTLERDPNAKVAETESA